MDAPLLREAVHAWSALLGPAGEVHCVKVSQQVWRLEGASACYALKRLPPPAAHRFSAFAATVREHPFLTPLPTDTGKKYYLDARAAYLLFPWLASPLTPHQEPAVARALARLHRPGPASAVRDLLPLRPVMDGVHSDHLVQEARACDATGVVAQACTLVEREITRREAWFDTVVQHGDLHPANIACTPAGDPLLLDAEFLHLGPQLYDLAFWTGCKGFASRAGFDSQQTHAFLGHYASHAPIRRVDCDTFFEMVVATRLHWLHRWVHDADSRAIGEELQTLRWLLDNKTVVRSSWRATLEQGVAGCSEKWIVQDAVIPPQAAALYAALDTARPQSLAEVLSCNPVPDVPLPRLLRYAVIAAARRGATGLLFDIIGWQEAYSERYPASESRREYARTLANASLDCARYRQHRAMELLQEKVFALARAWPGDEALETACAFVLRNYSVLLAEERRYSLSLAVVGRIAQMYRSRPASPELAGEYARALSSAIITTLRSGAEKMRERFLGTLQELAVRFADSPKVTGALTGARKNLARASISAPDASSSRSPHQP